MSVTFLCIGLQNRDPLQPVDVGQKREQRKKGIEVELIRPKYSVAGDEDAGGAGHGKECDAKCWTRERARGHRFAGPEKESGGRPEK
jgi:hypothetical protein